jgi:hypothetical protein
MRANKSTLPPIFVVGSGRSGTTWIGGVIGTCSGCVPVYEPLNLEYVSRCPRWAMPGAYLRKGDSYPEWEGFFDGLLGGRISNAWTRQDWASVPKFLARSPLAGRVGYRLAKCRYRIREMLACRYVIKEVYANLMLDWLAAYTGARIVYLIRHPCAVIGSRMRGPKGYWEFELDSILGYSSLMSDFLEPFRRTISAATTPLERQAILWCVENFVPLFQARSRDWLVCCYEDFVADPDGAFRRVFRFLGIEPSSRTRRARGQIVSNPTHDPHTHRPWHAPFSEVDGEEVLRVCKKFGLTLYGRQLLPLRSPKDLSDCERSRFSEASVHAETQTQLQS